MKERIRAKPIILTAEQQKKFWSKVVQGGGCWVWAGMHSDRGYGAFMAEGKRYMAHRVAYALTFGDPSPEMDVDHLCRNRGCCNPAHLEAVTHRENLLRGNGFAGRNSRKNHCAQGHEFTPENTGLNARGYRQCQTCKNAKTKVYCEKYRASAKGRARVLREERTRKAAAQAKFTAQNPGIPYSPGAAIAAAVPKGSAASNSRLTEVLAIEIRQKYAAGGYSFARLAKEYEVNKGTIGALITRRTWKHVL